ncbi:MAG: S9 family peptidase [Candidatus Kariarchaeaceae archaeon]
MSKIIPDDFLKLKKIEDIDTAGDNVVWVEKYPDPVNRTYKSSIILFNKQRGQIKQFTSGSKRDYFPRLSPDGKSLAFISNRNGTTQVFIMKLDGGEAHQATKMRHGVLSLQWSPDSKKIGFVALIDPNKSHTEEKEIFTKFKYEEKKAEEKEEKRLQSDPRVIHHLVYRTGTSYKDENQYEHIFYYDLETKETKQVSDGLYRHTAISWKSNTQVVTLSRRDKPRDLSTKYSVMLYDISLKSMGTAITSVHNRSIDRYLPPPVAYPDGPILVPKLDETKNLSGQVLQWALVQSDGSTKTINKQLDRTFTFVKWISDNTAVVAVESDGKVDLRRYDVSTDTFANILRHETSIESFSCTDIDEIFFVGTGPFLPSAVWKYNGNEASLVYDPNASFMEKKSIVGPEAIWLENPERIKYHGWFFDAGKQDGKNPPLILSIHGGPHAMWNNAGSMWHEWQCSISAGYSILAMNPIGSGGYGEEYMKSIRASWGINDARDLLTAVDHVLDRVDPERLYITGGSYAGFQTANIISRDHRFKAACAQRGVFDLTTFWMVTDIPLWYAFEWEGDVWQEGQHAKLWEHSPVARAPHIQTPLLIIHSENDFRVGISQAEELFAALRIQDKEAVLVRYPREGHELSRGGEALHIIDRLHRMLDWFDKHR